MGGVLLVSNAALDTQGAPSMAITASLETQGASSITASLDAQGARALRWCRERHRERFRRCACPSLPPYPPWPPSGTTHLDLYQIRHLDLYQIRRCSVAPMEGGPGGEEEAWTWVLRLLVALGMPCMVGLRLVPFGGGICGALVVEVVEPCSLVVVGLVVALGLRSVSFGSYSPPSGGALVVELLEPCPFAVVGALVRPLSMSLRPVGPLSAARRQVGPLSG